MGRDRPFFNDGNVSQTCFRARAVDFFVPLSIILLENYINIKYALLCRSKLFQKIRPFFG